MKKKYFPPLGTDLLSLFHDINGTKLVVNMQDKLPSHKADEGFSSSYTWKEYYTIPALHAICCGENNLAPRIQFTLMSGEEDEYGDPEFSISQIGFFAPNGLGLNPYLSLLKERLWHPHADAGEAWGEYFWESTSPNNLSKYVKSFNEKFHSNGITEGWSNWMWDFTVNGYAHSDEIKKALKPTNTFAGLRLKWAKEGKLVPIQTECYQVTKAPWNMLPPAIRKALLDMEPGEPFVLSIQLGYWMQQAYDKLSPYYDMLEKHFTFPNKENLGFFDTGGVVSQEYLKHNNAYLFNIQYDHDPNNCVFCSETGYVLDTSSVHQKLLEVIK